MRYTAMTMAAMFALVAGAASAEMHEGMEGEGKGGWTPPKTRQEAIERTNKRLDKLNKMSDQEWEEMHKRRMERREKWKNATPEQREEMRKHRMEKREMMKEHMGDKKPEEKKAE